MKSQKEETPDTCPKCRTVDFDKCHSMHCPMRKESPSIPAVEKEEKPDFKSKAKEYSELIKHMSDLQREACELDFEAGCNYVFETYVASKEVELKELISDRPPFESWLKEDYNPNCYSWSAIYLGACERTFNYFKTEIESQLKSKGENN